MCGKALGNDHAQTCLSGLTRRQATGRGGTKNEESPSGQPSAFQGGGKLRGAMQPRLWRKRGARHEQPMVDARNASDPVLTLDGQALAALGATSVQHGTAAAGFHAHAKAVGTLAAGN